MTSALHALDRLNSWLRSKDRETELMRGELKQTIYSTKVQAILKAHREGMAMSLRRIQDVQSCRRSAGTGIWFSPYAFHGDHGEPCRICRGSGRVALRFIESTFDGLKWHTPVNKWQSWSLDVYLDFPCIDQDYEVDPHWTVNLPGRELTLEEVVNDFREVMRHYADDVYFSLEFHYHLKLRNNHLGHSIANQWLDQLIEKQRNYPTFFECSL